MTYFDGFSRVQVSFFRGSLLETVAAIESLFGSQGVVLRVVSPNRSLRIGELLSLLPGSAEAPAAALFESIGCVGWTAIVGSTGDGWLSLPRALARAGLNDVTVCAAVDTSAVPFPSALIEVITSQTSSRKLHSWRDVDGWHFIDRGERLPFENGTIYRKRNIRDRMNLSVIENFLAGFGITLSQVWSEAATQSLVVET